jgi:hypothetical protein
LSCGVLAVIIQVGFEYPILYGFEILLRLTPQTQDYLSNVLVGGLTWRDRVAGEVANALSILLLVPFFVSVLTVFYYDLRVRKEAFDVELLASDLSYPPLSQLGDYLPAAMVFQSPGMPRPAERPPYGGPPPPIYGGSPPPPSFGAPPQGYAQPYGPGAPNYAPPPTGAPQPGWTPPQSGAPVPPNVPPPPAAQPPSTPVNSGDQGGGV